MILELMNTLPKDVINVLANMKFVETKLSCEDDIVNLLEQTVLVGGKRLRPLLTHLVGQLFNVAPDKLDIYAKSIELVHAASLSHDDVIDNATSRRGLPSINIVGSNKRAVLAGDYLLAQVIVDLTKAGNLELVEEMSKVIQELSVGEWIQLDSIESRKYSREIISEIAHKKTASVMSWCCVAPALLSNQKEETVEKMRSFGAHLGLAFQLMDDTLDFSASGEKDHLLDLQNGIVNSVIYEWLELNPESKLKFENGEKILDLFNGSQIDVAVDTIRKEALNHLDQCHSILTQIKSETDCSENIIKPLEMILEYLAQRKK